jgi:hypothetical protein
VTDRVLYLVTCGAPLTTRIGDGVAAARAAGWTPVVIPTEASLAWIPDGALDDALSVTEHREPGQDKRLPPADAVAVVPMTFNTLTAWATGRADTYALSTLCARLGAGTPCVAVPFAKHDLAGHPAWATSLDVLRKAGVILVDPSTGSRDRVASTPSGQGDAITAAFQWEWVVDALP